LKQVARRFYYTTLSLIYSLTLDMQIRIWKLGEKPSD
jgi:hypothetical protein